MGNRGFASRTLLLAVLIVGVLVAITLAYRSGGPETTQPPVAPAAPAPPATLASPADPAQLERDRSRALQRQQDQAEAQYRSAAQRFEAQSRDPAWAAATEARLARAARAKSIADVQAVPASFDADCRQSSCRVEAGFASATALEDWMTLYMLEAGPELGQVAFHHTRAADGGVRVTLYGARAPPTPATASGAADNN